MSEPRKDDVELLAEIRKQLRSASTARVLVAFIELQDEGPPVREEVKFVASDNFDQVGDGVAVADQVLRHVSGILSAQAPSSPWARERLPKVEAARAALEFETVKASS